MVSRLCKCEDLAGVYRVSSTHLGLRPAEWSGHRLCPWQGSEECQGKRPASAEEAQADAEAWRAAQARRGAAQWGEAWRPPQAGRGSVGALARKAQAELPTPESRARVPVSGGAAASTRVRHQTARRRGCRCRPPRAPSWEQRAQAAGARAGLGRRKSGTAQPPRCFPGSQRRSEKEVPTARAPLSALHPLCCPGAQRCPVCWSGVQRGLCPRP